MDRVKRNRFMLAAPASGSGKTVITCGLLRLLQKKGWECSSFKCGPDYIDPMFHKEILGISGGNLDSFFLAGDQIRKQLIEQSTPGGISVIEGVMGYYDGMGGVSTAASSYEVALVTETPVILIIDGKRSSLSICAVIKGFLEYRSNHQIKGVILNRVSAVMADRLKPLIEELGIELVGYLPLCQAAMLESRHLGLVIPMENKKSGQKIEELSLVLEQTIDLEKLYRIAKGAREMDFDRDKQKVEKTAPADTKVKIGIARDQAFCFYYQENLALLEQLGAVIVPFSPLHDDSLPEGINGLLLGGGYPEVYAKELEDNVRMRDSINVAVEQGIPLVAECGGFLYLHKKIEGEDGRTYLMAGVIDAEAYRTKLNKQFGYIGIQSNMENFWLGKNEIIKGHEFHYWESSDSGDAFYAKKPIGDRGWNCMHTSTHMLAGFPHLYYPSNPEIARRFLSKCRAYEINRRKGSE